MNKYADTIKVIKGILMGPLTITTRIHEWVIKAIENDTRNDNHSTIPPIDSAAQAANNASLEASPWTCVNNCNDIEENNDSNADYAAHQAYIDETPPIPIEESDRTITHDEYLLLG